MHGKKITLFVLLLTCLFLCTTAASGTTLSLADISTNHQIYFQDDFSRPDSDLLGGSWIEANENDQYVIHSHENLDYLIGTGVLDVDNESLSFHYTNHPQKGILPNFASNWRPIAYAPLSKPARLFPVQMSFTFMPHSDERIHHDVGLMAGDDGLFEDTWFIPIFVPKTGVGVRVIRSDRYYNNSQVRIFWYEGEVRTELSMNTTSFQFDSGESYAVNLIIDRQETTVEVSNGVATDTFSVATPEIIFAPDYLFISDTQGGIGQLTAGSGDYRTYFDDFVVSGPFYQVMLPVVLNTYCVSAVDSLDVVLLLDISASMKLPISPNGPTKLATAQDALVEFLNLMELSRDQTGVVTFANGADVLHGLSQDREGLITAVQSISAGGISRLDLGLTAAHQEAVGIRHHDNAVPVLIMLTDGEPNGADEATVLQAAEAAKAAGIEIYTVGFGPAVNINLLKEIATDPSYFYNAPSSDDLSAIYQQILVALNCHTH